MGQMPEASKSKQKRNGGTSPKSGAKRTEQERISIFGGPASRMTLLLDIVCVVERWVAEFASHGLESLRIMLLHLIVGSSALVGWGKCCWD